MGTRDWLWHPFFCLRSARSRLTAIGALALSLGVAFDAAACGCFAPPVIPDDFAVNQRAEQIVFEVGGEVVSAHVRILYEGDPEQFAWLLPVPTVPELELSETSLFSLVDQRTEPLESYRYVDLCPEQRYVCRTHPPCYDGDDDYYYDDDAPADDGVGDDDVGDDDVGGDAPAVTVLASARVGSYDTVTFAAEDAGLAIDWLRDNDFIVNETMSPYMQPYLDAEMVFVASKLVPGADLDEIRPLRITYQAEYPAIPLRLTAVAAEPHMMVTAFIYAQQEYEPYVAPLVTLPEDDLAAIGRYNAPMVMARAIDEAGGFAFVKEYVGKPPRVDTSGQCCNTVAEVVPVPSDAEADAGAGSTTPELVDVCYLGSDGICQCPGAEFEGSDCDEGLVRGVELVTELAEKYPLLTRLTTRISPEEMIEDPLFRVAEVPGGGFRLNLRTTEYSLDGCEEQVEDRQTLGIILESEACAATYCDFGECVVSAGNAGCVCDPGFVARVFNDSDGQPSITCAPEEPRVDFSAGGIELAGACPSGGVVDGQCVELGGFPGVRCDDGLAAFLPTQSSLGAAFAECLAFELATSGPGARNFGSGLQALEVCEPPPPSCPAGGWLERRAVSRRGKDCGDAPDSSWFEVPPAPSCDDVANDQGLGDDGDRPEDHAPATATSNEPMDTRQPRPTDRSRAEGDSRSGRCAVWGRRSAGTGWIPWLGLLVAAGRARATRRAVTSPERRGDARRPTSQRLRS